MLSIIEAIVDQSNKYITISQKRPGIWQVYLPVFHEDGDMFEIYLTKPSASDETIRVCDFGMTIMRLSYEYDIDTENKQKIFNRIMSENYMRYDNGNIYIESEPASLYSTILHFCQVISKVMNMGNFKREIIKDLFYEDLNEFLNTECKEFLIEKSYFPLENRDDLEVDYLMGVNKAKLLYVFGVGSGHKAKLVTISCLEFQKSRLPFTSVVVHSNMDELSRKDRMRITNVSDKQFAGFDDFKKFGREYFDRVLSNGKH